MRFRAEVFTLSISLLSFALCIPCRADGCVKVFGRDITSHDVTYNPDYIPKTEFSSKLHEIVTSRLLGTKSILPPTYKCGNTGCDVNIEIKVNQKDSSIHKYRASEFLYKCTTLIEPCDTCGAKRKYGVYAHFVWEAGVIDFGFSQPDKYEYNADLPVIANLTHMRVEERLNDTEVSGVSVNIYHK